MFGAFTRLYNISTLSNSRTFSSPKRKHINYNYPPVPLPQPLAIHHLISLHMDLSVLDISYKWSHTMHGLALASCPQHIMFKVYPCCKCQCFYSPVIFHCIAVAHFISQKLTQLNTFAWAQNNTQSIYRCEHTIRSVCLWSVSFWEVEGPIVRQEISDTSVSDTDNSLAAVVRLICININASDTFQTSMGCLSKNPTNTENVQNSRMIEYFPFNSSIILEK